MRLEFFGHACFGIQSAGLRILLDPYEPGGFNGRMRYTGIPGTWDLVIVSHEHRDHSHVTEDFRARTVLTGPGSFQGVEVRTFSTEHGDAGGTMSAETRISRFELEGMVLVHPGDAAGPLDEAVAANLRPVDVLFLPVGGHFTAGPAEADQLLHQLRPRVAVPMHYKTPLADLTIRPLKDFTSRTSYPITARNTGVLDFQASDLPPRTTIWTMNMTCM